MDNKKREQVLEVVRLMYEDANGILERCYLHPNKENSERVNEMASVAGLACWSKLSCYADMLNNIF